MIKRLTLAAVFCCAFLGMSAQRFTDKLDRGLVAVKTTNGVYCSWRINADEYYDVKYNIYRDGVKLNASPLNVSNYTDASGSLSSTYTVRPVVRGVEKSASAAVSVMQNNWKEIAPKHDASLTSTYVPNDACCADVDGDGELEILMKYDNQSEINESFPYAGHNGEYSLFECLKLDGTVLWWVNCGPNMGDFQNNEANIVAYDWDMDGKAEAVFRAADGTTIHMADGTTYVVGDATKNYRGATGGGTNWFMHSGAEFLVYVNGQTGRPYQCVDYPLKRLEDSENPNHLLSGSVYDDLVKAAWGDGYGHRSTKHFFGAPYLDGKKPSIFLGRGIYTRHKFVAYDVDASTHQLVERWRWTNNKAGSPWYAQGYHNYSIADVDWDGRDEIVWGSMVIDDNGKGLSTTGLGHGDSHHVGDFNPYVHGQEFFACNEDSPSNNYRDATTSKIYYRVTGTEDDGRAICGNFSNSFPGAMGITSHDYSTPISCVTNGHITNVTTSGVTQNFRIYWDGDLCEESFNGSGTRNSTGVIYKFGNGSPIATLTGSYTNNDTKATPCFQGDVFGDWREEVIMRTADNKIRIYTTITPTEHRNYSLWYDHQYRNAMVWQMCGYNQTPHASYFLGELEGITIAPPPLTTEGREQVALGGTISTDLNDKHVLVSNYENGTVAVANGASPSIATINVPSLVSGTAASECTTKETPITYNKYTVTLTGSAFGGPTRLVKQGDGELVLPEVTQTYAGSTDVWAGTLTFDGTMQNSHVWLNRFAELNSKGTFSKGVKADYGSVIRPAGDAFVGTLTVTDSLKLVFGARVVFDFSSESNDKIVTDVLCLEKKNWQNGPKYSAPVFEINAVSGSIVPGKYEIAQVGKIEGSIDDVVVEGVLGKKVQISYESDKIYLTVLDVRAAENIVWTGAESSVWDIDVAHNFQSSSSTFVADDNVEFNDAATNTTVNVSANVTPKSVVFNNSSKNYTLTGNGSVEGSTSLVKNGSGTLNVNNVNKYQGGTMLNSGVIVPSSLANADGSDYGALGGVNGKIAIANAATLKTTSNITTSQPIEVGAGGATINVASGTLIASGSIYKKSGATCANIYKDGSGTLQLNSSSAIAFDTLYVNQGTVYDFSDKHFSNRVVVLNGGTLKYNNSIYGDYSENARFVVPAGKTSTLYPDGRCDYTGALTGEGTLNLYATWVRLQFKGNWSEFTGTIKAYQGPKVGTYNPTFDFVNTYGIGKATLEVQSGCTVNTNGKNFAIGALTGSGNISNGGYWNSATNTLAIGGKNIDFTFSGAIIGSSVQKVGTGTWTISNATALSQAKLITVKEGWMRFNSTSSTSLTGTNGITVSNGGSVRGKGVVQYVTLNSGATLVAGLNTTYTSNSGAFKAVQKINAGEGSDIYVNKMSRKDKNDLGQIQYSYLDAPTLILNGTIHVTYKSGSGGWTPAAGDSMRVFVASSITGTPTWDLQALPTGLAWDKSTVMTDGILRVITASADGIVLSENEPVMCEFYTTSGVKVAQIYTSVADMDRNVREQGIPKGVYIVKIGAVRRKITVK